MNDFDLDQLILIKRGLDLVMNSCIIDDEPKVRLARMKVQSMLDNYCEITPPTMASYCCEKCNEEWKDCECRECEHQWITIVGRVLGNGHHVPGMTICNKCGTKK